MDDFQKHLRQLRGSRAFAAAFDKKRAEAEVAFQIRRLRESKGWSQKDLAKKVGCSQQAVSAVEQAGYKRHSLPLLRRIAHVLGADVVVALVPRKAAQYNFAVYGAEKPPPPDTNRRLTKVHWVGPDVKRRAIWRPRAPVETPASYRPGCRPQYSGAGRFLESTWYGLNGVSWRIEKTLRTKSLDVVMSPILSNR